jgi:ABC-type multidrug transport system permease subunit
MDANRDLAVRAPARRHRTLAAILCIWLVAVPLAVGSALSSDYWPAIPQVPTPDQVSAARSAAWGAAAVAVTPLAIGLLLAGRWRSYGWAIAFGVLLMFAVLGSALLLQMTASPAHLG